MDIHNVLIIGAGTMGHGIAHVAAQAGCKAHLYDVDAEVVEKGLKQIEANLRKGVDKGKINIRVGGGYLSIDEFLDQYTPAELEKLERMDPLKRLSDASSPISRGSPNHSPTARCSRKSPSPRKVF